MSNLFLFTSNQLLERKETLSKILREKRESDNVQNKDLKKNKLLYKEMFQIDNILEERGDL